MILFFTLLAVISVNINRYLMRLQIYEEEYDGLGEEDDENSDENEYENEEADFNKSKMNMKSPQKKGYKKSIAGLDEEDIGEDD